MSAAVKRNDVGMCVQFARAPIPASLEFANGFTVDFSPDDDVIGLEFLYPDGWHIGCEPEMLAFGVFGSALVWLGYNYAKHSGPEMRWAVLRKAKRFIAAADLGMQVAASGRTGLTIKDAGGNVLLCADFRYHPRRIFKRAKYATSTDDPVLPARGMAEIRATIQHLTQTVLPANPRAIGVAVAVDEFPYLRYESPVSPGRWIDWPKARSPKVCHVWAHIAIIPPHNGTYPWLPQHFLDFPA